MALKLGGFRFGKPNKVRPVSDTMMVDQSKWKCCHGQGIRVFSGFGVLSPLRQGLIQLVTNRAEGLSVGGGSWSWATNTRFNPIDEARSAGLVFECIS
jgi:hypothetical protein